MAEPAPHLTKEGQRFVHRFIHENCISPPTNATWGFAIFRTVYTAFADENWALALARINSYVALEVSEDISKDDTLDPAPNNLIISQFQCKIFEDKETLDGVGGDTIKEMFLRWKETESQQISGGQTSPHVLTHACILVDDEVLHSLLVGGDPSQPEAQASKNSDGPRAFLKLIDTARSGPTDSDSDESGVDEDDDEDYQGCVRIDAEVLWFAANILRDCFLEGRYTKEQDGSLYFD